MGKRVFVRFFSNFDMKLGRIVELDALNNFNESVIAKFFLWAELFTLENRPKIALFRTFLPITRLLLNRSKNKSQLPHP